MAYLLPYGTASSTDFARKLGAIVENKSPFVKIVTDFATFASVFASFIA